MHRSYLPSLALGTMALPSTLSVASKPLNPSEGGHRRPEILRYVQQKYSFHLNTRPPTSNVQHAVTHTTTLQGRFWREFAQHGRTRDFRIAVFYLQLAVAPHDRHGGLCAPGHDLHVLMRLH